MSISFEQLKEEAEKLTSNERAELAAELLRSLEPENIADLDEIEQDWICEAERRLAEVRRGEAETIPGDESVARLRQATSGPRPARPSRSHGSPGSRPAARGGSPSGRGP